MRSLHAVSYTHLDVYKRQGFLEVYVQQLSNFLASNNFSSDQYDIMIGALGNIESYGDEIALQYFGKTLDEMRGQAEEEADKKNESNKGDNKFDVPASDSWAAQVVDKMTNDQLIKSLNEIVNTGKMCIRDSNVAFVKNIRAYLFYSFCHKSFSPVFLCNVISYFSSMSMYCLLYTSRCV